VRQLLQSATAHWESFIFTNFTFTYNEIIVFWCQCNKENTIILLIRALPNSDNVLFLCEFEFMDVDCTLRNLLIPSCYSTCCSTCYSTFYMLMKDFVWALAGYSTKTNQSVSSWTGFNMLVRQNHFVLKDTVGYLPTINLPATQINIVFEILSKANSIKDNLNLPSIIVGLDQAIYSKAIEITWKYQETFQIGVLRMGTFHTIGVLLNILGLWFGYAGLQDLVIESSRRIN